jgi:hypothetical protein
MMARNAGVARNFVGPPNAPYPGRKVAVGSCRNWEAQTGQVVPPKWGVAFATNVGRSPAPGAKVFPSLVWHVGGNAPERRAA